MNVDLKLLEQILMRLPNAIFWKDNNSVYRGCNSNFAKSVGFNHPEDVIGKTDEQMPWDEESAKLYREEDLIILNGGTIVDKEVTLPIDKTEKIILISKSALYDSDQNIIGVLGVYTDITKEKLAKKAKADFISNMEHDLKTPFSGIGGIADVLYSEAKDADSKEMLGLMVTSCQQWEAIHHRIFDALVADQSKVVFEAFSIESEVEKVREMMMATLHLKGLKLIINPMPAGQLGIIKTDSFKFHLILLNLVGNAINFTQKGQITISVIRQEACFLIQITDTGIGIPADKFDYIFEQFTKLSLSNKHGSDFKGIGSGLYIARNYATSLGGIIRVESEVNQGSQFTLTLPVSYPA